MSYKDEINEKLKKALKDRDALRASVLRMLLSALGYKEVEKRKPLTDEEFFGVVRSMIKQHVESIDSFKKGQRQDLVDKEEKELLILNEFAPALMSVEEVAQEVESAIKELGAVDQKDMGRVMKVLMGKLASRADGKVLSQMVKDRLSCQRPS
jgi:uncharacterized protein